jgi:hypothetical protein
MSSPEESVTKACQLAEEVFKQLATLGINSLSYYPSLSSYACSVSGKIGSLNRFGWGNSFKQAIDEWLEMKQLAEADTINEQAEAIRARHSLLAEAEIEALRREQLKGAGENV